MTTLYPTIRDRFWTACACASLCFAGSLSAQIYRVTMDTEALVTSSAAPFHLDFQLFDGAGSGDASTTAYLTNFVFGGGSAVGVPSGSGLFSGSLTTSLTLTDGDFFNEVYQEFIPGSFLQFDVRFSVMGPPGPTPDSFVFAILDSTLSNLPTLAGGSDAFLMVELTAGAAPAFSAYGSDPTVSPAAGGDPLGLSMPSVQAVPEPSTYGAFGAGGLAVLVLATRRKARR